MDHELQNSRENSEKVYRGEIDWQNLPKWESP